MNQSRDVGCVSRLYGMMQALMADRVGNTPADWATYGARNIVSEDDAVEAVIQIAAALDQSIQDGVLDREKLAFAGAVLMVLRDYVRPLPGVSSSRSSDAVGDDLQEMVDALREGCETRH